MTKLHKITIALFLLLTMLLSGCAEQSREHGTDTNTSSDISGSDPSESSEDLDSDSNSTVLESSNSESESTADSMSDSQNTSDSDPENSTSGNKQLVIPTEFTDEDRELQEILKDLLLAYNEIEDMFSGGYMGDMYYTFKFSDYDTYYYPIPEDTRIRPNSLFTVPQTYAGMEELLLKYLTSQSADIYMMWVNTGTMTENPDGTYTVNLDNEEKGPAPFLEIDGKMYYSGGAMGRNGLDCETAKVIEKTDDTIIFSCIESHGEPDYINEPERSWNIEGMLKYERGGWKLHYNNLTFFEYD